jgi:pterin-4a-carbinolamine dehydratase
VKTLFEFVDKRFIENRQQVQSNVERAIGTLNSTLPEMLPIDAEQSKWEIMESPERLSRSFQFDDGKSIKFFIDELFEEQERLHHHALITVDYRTVTVETYTHDVNNVTEQDQKLAKFCDEVYEDIKYIDMVSEKDDD